MEMKVTLEEGCAGIPPPLTTTRPFPYLSLFFSLIKRVVYLTSEGSEQGRVKWQIESGYFTELPSRGW